MTEIQSLAIRCASANEAKLVEVALKTTLNVQRLLSSCPPFAYCINNRDVLVYGISIDVVKSALKNTFDYDVPEQPAEAVVNTVLHRTNDNALIAGEERIVDPFDDSFDSIEDQKAHNTLVQDSRNSLVALNGVPDLATRYSMAETVSRFASMWHQSPLLSEDVRLKWQTIYDRMFIVPQPTGSTSGAFTHEDQLDFSRKQNPRRWNLVKVEFRNNYSQFPYLTYLCPPTVDMETTLRIIGGVHCMHTPTILEICVYNTPEYWRELRHMMHKQVPFLREAVAA